MSDTDSKLNIRASEDLAPPAVNLTRIAAIDTIEIMVNELNQVEEAASEEKTSLAFFTLFFGALISTMLSVPAADASAQRWGAFVAIVCVSAAGSGWFFLAWLRKRRSAARILSHIRERAGISPRQEVVAREGTRT